ncbi:MerR family transcriptional regulator [Glaciihabitans sp. INWT7]|uniref:MerR family transcriptional regulator n=1 Tax=Glaciihabitans sp. INWT7 TaxID=2596912 RepID=UPI0016239825|nr:MerR family transcriptional regulator [Glaciihabitans sp. INWT7]QNE47619.1 MerR family transcriptional regulator [Glaciihabitans sp. INWT7]
MERAEATMHIGELAERTGLSLRTIRHYDEVGLLEPTGRTVGGFRLYTHDDFGRLMLIRRMKPLGFTLEEMTELLRIIDSFGSDRAGSDDPGESHSPVQTHNPVERAKLDSFIAQAVERRAKLEQQLAMADEFLELLRAQ